ncbi:MAG TPA: dihydrolipoyl dehydrogenase [Telluria sp.]|nr:dihydrolipoyl dehydrogenase [Telluria sp.]
MRTIDVDVAILGTGTAGLSAYRAAVAHGKRALLIERGPYGTTCARVGCMPSKLLIAAADAAHMLDLAPAFGVHPGEKRIDGKAVMARVQKERDRFVGFVIDSVESIPEADRLVGHARFTSARALQVDDHTIVNASRFVIATGSTPLKLPVLEAGGAAIISSDDIFELDDLPASMAVIGTGVIGLELGQAMARLGVRVSFFARGGSIAQLTDPDVLHDAVKVFGGQFDIRFQQRIVKVAPNGNGVLLTTRDAVGAEKVDEFQTILVAAGRTPNVGDIGIDKTGLTLDQDGIPVFNRCTMQCGDSHMFIAGDADDERPLLAEAADQGRIAGDNAGRFPDVRPGLRRTALAVAFTEPQIATVGESYRELCAAGKPKFALGMVSFENQGRSRVMLQNHGMLRVYAEYGTGRFLGAEMVGPRAEHIGHLLAWACQARMTVDQMLEMPFYHPVIEEGLRTALRHLHEELAKDASDIAVGGDAAGV